MATKYKRLTSKEASTLLNAVDTEPKKPHAFNRQILHWPYCGRCGLMALKNKATRKAMKKPC